MKVNSQFAPLLPHVLVIGLAMRRVDHKATRDDKEGETFKKNRR
jgi:hypothetical protein